MSQGTKRNSKRKAEQKLEDETDRNTKKVSNAQRIKFQPVNIIKACLSGKIQHNCNNLLEIDLNLRLIRSKPDQTRKLEVLDL
jgi:hypothetical protein